MDKQDSLKTILNHLLDTAVYVIRQDSHGILYFNDRVKTVTPDIALGQVCHDVWEGSCENCPLKTMDGKQSNTTLSFDDPFGEVVSITATEMMWEEDIPAYVISVTPQVKTKKEQELELACKQLVGVTAQMYPVVLSINLTKNTYNIIEYRDGTATNRENLKDVDALVENAIRTIHVDFREEFRRRFRRKAIIEAFHAGKTEIYMEHKQLGADGVYHWTCTHVLKTENPYDDDILELTLHKNIDAQKRIEEQLQNALDFACESAGGITGKYLVTDHEIYTLEMSRKYVDYFGKKSAGYAGGILKAVPKWAKRYLHRFSDAAKKRETVFFEFPYKKNGGDVWLQMQASCVGEQDGWPVYFGTIMDISARKQLELEREATYNSLPGGIAKIVIDDQFTLEEANNTFYRMLGMSEQDFKDGYLCHVYEEDRAELEATVREQVEKKKSIFVEYRIPDATGEILWVHVEGRRIGRKGRYPVYLTVVINITEQKRAQLELEKEQLKYRVAIETSADVLFEYVAETDTFYSYESNEYPDGSVRTEKRVIEHYLRDLDKLDIIYPDDLKNVRRIMHGGAHRMEIRLRRSDDHKFAWFFFQGDALREKGRIVRVIGTLRDISQSKENDDRRAYLQEICNFVCNKDYQLLATIDLQSGHYHCAFLPEGGPYSRAPRDGYFQDESDLFVGNSVYEEDKAMALEAFRLENILAHLDAGEREYSIYYRVIEHDGSVRWKSLVFSYFGSDTSTLLAAARDIQAIQDTKLKERIANQTLEVALERIYDKVMYLNLSQKRIEFIRSRGTYDYLKNPEEMEFETDVLPKVHPADRQELFEKTSRDALLEMFAKGESSVYVESRRIAKDGEYHWTAVNVVRMEDSEDGNIMAMLLISTIDERKLMEQEREEFAAGVATLFEESVTVNATKGTYILRRLQDSWDDFSEQGVYESDFEDYCEGKVHPEDRGAFRQVFSLDAIRVQLKEGIGKVRREFRFLTGEGYRWMEMIAVPVQNTINEDGKAILIYRDIHALKIAQEEQKTANRRFSVAVSSLYDVIFEGDLATGKMYIWQNDGDILKKVPASFTLDQYFEKMEWETIHPDYRADYRKAFRAAALVRAFENGQHEVYLEAPRRMEDGSYRWYSMQAQFVMRDAGGFRVMLYLKDLDDVKKEEESKRNALMDALAIAKEANNAKTDFLSRMSHDIRTPMNAIIGMTHLAKVDVTDTAKVEECLGQIDVSAKFLLSLINDILDMSKIESGKMAIVRKRFRFGDLINGICAVMEAQAIQRNQTLTVLVDEQVEKTYIGDQLRLNQVLMNLLSNALKYTHRGGRIALRVKVLSEDKETSMLCFEVEDNGIGMSKEFLERLYHPFEQEDESGGRVFEGTGLGLSITENLVHLMNGHIYVQSERGKGSLFMVNLPLGRTEQKEANETFSTGFHNCEPGKAENQSMEFHGERVLIVEDNEINRDIAIALLEMKDLVVDSAGNGLEAVERFSSMPDGYYQAILMDIRMPEMDGIEATQKIRALERTDARTVPIIALTANAFQEEIEHARRIGMSDYLIKPIDTEVLYQTLAEAIYGKQR